jgi:hypothetical protein
MKRLDQPATGEPDNEELIVAGRAQERRQPGTASTERHGGRRTSFKVLTVVRSLRKRRQGKRRQRKRRKWHVAKTRNRRPPNNSHTQVFAAWVICFSASSRMLEGIQEEAVPAPIRRSVCPTVLATVATSGHPLALLTGIQARAFTGEARPERS